MVRAGWGIESCQNLFQEDLLALGYVDGRLSKGSMSRFRNHLVDNFSTGVSSGRGKLNREANWGAGCWKPKEDIDPPKTQLGELLMAIKKSSSAIWPVRKRLRYSIVLSLCWLDRKDPLGVSLPSITLNRIHLLPKVTSNMGFYKYVHLWAMLGILCIKGISSAVLVFRSVQLVS